MMNGHSSLREFGGCRLDLEKRLLWAKSDPVSLPAKAVELLCLLVENAGSVVTKKEIWSEVWPDAFVEETNLTHNIYLLRKALRDLGEPNLIKTVPRRGYRFTGVVHEIPESEITLERHVLTRTTVEFAGTPVAATVRPTLMQVFARPLVLVSLAAFAAGIASLGLAWQAGYAFPETARKRALFENVEKRRDANELYLKGRQEWNKRRWQEMVEAEQYFRTAIDRDPDFALAYSGLADCLAMQGNTAETRGLIEHALELDPNLAEGYASRGFYEIFLLRRWDEAEADLRRSIALKPDYGTAHQWLGVLFEIQGRNDEALAEMQRAVEIDPASPNFLADLGQTYYFRRDYPNARLYCLKALEIDPDFIFAHNYLLNISLLLGDTRSAVEQWKASTITFSTSPNISDRQRKEFEARAAEIRNKYIDAPREDFIESIIQKEDVAGPSGYFNSRLYALLGDRSAAIASLERGISGDPFGTVFVKADPVFDPIRDEPGYQAVVKKMGLSE